MGKTVDIISWVFLVFFAIPTVLIMASWQSLPGEPMYNVKLALEKVLLTVASPSYAAEASLNVKYTERRLSETKVLLANRKSGQGLAYLTQQVEATKAMIDRAPNEATRKVLARQYIQTLQQVSTELAQQRDQIAYTEQTGQAVQQPGTSGNNTSGTNPVILPTSTPRGSSFVPTPTTAFVAQAGVTVSPTAAAQPTQRIFPTATPVRIASPTIAPQNQNTPNNQNVVQEIDNTQQQIQNVIQNLEQAAADSQPSDQGNQQQIQQIQQQLQDKSNEDGKGSGNNNNDHNNGPFNQNNNDHKNDSNNNGNH